MRITHPIAVLAVLLATLSVPAQEKPVGKGGRDYSRNRKLGYAVPLVLEKDHEVHGAKLAGRTLVPLAALGRKAGKWDGKTIQVRGTIARVCPKKGCWMRVRSGEDEVFVRFKDYAFFVPFDVAGRPVAAEGVLEVRTMTEAERRHYAEDAGKSPEEIAKIVGDVTTVQLTAEAVRIGKLPPPPKKPTSRKSPAEPCPAGPDCPVCAEERAKKKGR